MSASQPGPKQEQNRNRDNSPEPIMDQDANVVIQLHSNLNPQLGGQPERKQANAMEQDGDDVKYYNMQIVT